MRRAARLYPWLGAARLKLPGLAGSLLAAAALASCAVADTSKKTAAASPSKETLPLEVTRGTLDSGIVLSGLLRSEGSAEILSPHGGWGLAIRWMAENGSLVKKGDRVLEMDTTAIVAEIEGIKNRVLSAGSDLRMQKDTAEIQIADKENALAQAKIELEKARLQAEVPQDAYPKRTYEDMQAAFKRAQVKHQGAVEELETERKVQRLTIEQKTEAYRKVLRELEAAEGKVDSYVFTAPRDGILVAGQNWREGRPLQVGDKTWPGHTILEIPDLSSMVAEAELSDVDDGRVHPGMRARCFIDAYPDTPIEGKVRTVSPVAKAPQNQSLRRAFEVVIELDTGALEIRPGMSMRAEIVDGRSESLLIPRRALRFDGKTPHSATALLADGSEREVEISLCSNNACELVSGIELGSKLRAR